MRVAGPRVTPSGPGGAGLALAVLSAATFGTSGTFASSLIQAGWSPAAAVLTRIAVSALILTAPALVQLRGRWHLLRRAAPRVAAYGLIAVAGCQLFYFNAVQRIPVGVALLLEYLGTVLVVGWLWLRHGERPRRLHRHRHGVGDRRADPGPRPHRRGADRPDRGDVGPAGRGGPGHLLRAVGVRR